LIRKRQEIIEAQKKMRVTLEDWIPKILAAQDRTAICKPPGLCATRTAA